MSNLIEGSVAAAQVDFDRPMAGALRGEKVVIMRDGVAVVEPVPPRG